MGQFSVEICHLVGQFSMKLNTLGRIGVAPCRIGQSESHPLASAQFASNRGSPRRFLANAVICAGRKDVAAQWVPNSSRTTNSLQQ